MKQFTKQKKLVQYILESLDRHYQRGMPVDYNQMTIEHIASETSSADPDVIAQLGNLILVDQPLNTELGNKSFADKKRILAKSKAWVDPIIQNAESWDEDDIKKRTQKIENPNSRVGGCCLLEFTLISVVHHKPHSTSFYDV